MADWNAIRTEYITTATSYRKLAEKYGVSFCTLRDRAKRENWAEERKTQHDKVVTETAQAITDVVVKNEVKRVERLLSISDKLIDKIERAVAELDRAQVTNKTKTKVIEYKNGKRPDKPTKETITEKEEILAVASIIDRKGLQQVATALKAVWDISGQDEASKEDKGKDTDRHGVVLLPVVAPMPVPPEDDQDG